MLRKVNVVQNYGNRKAMLDMIASEATDLPSINDVVEGYEVQSGSMAYIVQSDIWATLDSDDKWYSGGQEVSTESDDTEPAQSLNLSPQALNLRPGANFEPQLNEIQQASEETPDEETEEEEQPEEEEEPAIKEVFPNYEESIEEPEKDVNDDEELV